MLPASLLTGLTSDQLQTLLTHEMAHIRRYDLLVNLLQRLIEALLFFHPAVWIVSRCLSTERENIADDIVIASGWKPARYVDALVRMAELSSSLRNARQASELTTLAASGNSSSELHCRVMRLLENTETPRVRLTWSSFLVAMLVAAALLATPLLVTTQADELQQDSAAEKEREDSVEKDETESPSVDIDPREVFAQLVAADHWRPRREASKQLADLGVDGHNLLLAGTQHESDEVREECFERLRDRFPKDQKTIDVILAILREPASKRAKRLRYSGVFHLGYHRISRGASVLRDIYRNEDELRLTAAKSLAELGDRRVLMTLYDNLGSNWYMERYQANIGIKALTGKDLNDFDDYDWAEGAFVSGGREAVRAGRRPEDAEVKAARFEAIAAFHKWLRDEKPELDAILDPTADRHQVNTDAESRVLECRVSGGKSAAGAEVTVTLTQAANPKKPFGGLVLGNNNGQVLKQLTYTAGDDGRYRIVVPGRYASMPGLLVGISVRHPDLLDREVGPVLLTDFDKQHIATDQPYWLHRQMNRQAILTTRLRPAHILEGRVLKWDGTPAAGATVKSATKYQPYSWKHHSPDDYGFASKATTDVDGGFKLEVDQRATMTISLPGQPILLIDNLGKPVDVSGLELPETDELSEFKLPRGVLLRGRVLDDEGSPQPRVIVTARRKFPWNEFNMPLGYSVSCATDENGEYEFPRLPADHYSFSTGVALADDADFDAYNARARGEVIVEKQFRTQPLDLVFVPVEKTLSEDNQLPVLDLKASPMARLRVKVEFPDGPPDPDRSSDVGIAGRIDGRVWQGRYVSADESELAVLRAPIGLDGTMIKTGLAKHRRSPGGTIEIGQAVHFKTLTEDINGVTVIKSKTAKLKVKLTLPEELSRRYSQSKAHINIGAWHKREGFREQSPKRQKLWLVGSMQSGATRYRGTALSNEPLILQVSVKEDDTTRVLHEEELTLKPDEERLVAIAIDDLDDQAEAARRAEELNQETAAIVARSAKYLLTQQKADGSWPAGSQNQYAVGTTALAGLALLDAGISRQDDRLRRTTLFLLQAEPKMTKEVALQAMYLNRCGKPGRVVCRRSIRWLLDAQLKSGQLSGAWGYQQGGLIESGGDMANTVFAIRALCELASRNEDHPEFVPEEVWQRTADLLARAQKSDGSWGYTPRVAQPSGSMTVCMLRCLKNLKTQVSDEDEVVRDAINQV